MKNFAHISRVALLASVLVGAGGGAVAQDIDWTGFYGGLSYGTVSDDESLISTGFPLLVVSLEGGGAGAFAGYNAQIGSMVYGVELAFNSAMTESTGSTITRQDFIDLKGRLGRAVNDWLVYGALGYSTATLREAPGNVDVTTNGWSYGIGVDYAVTPNIIVGAEFLRRQLETDYTSSGFPTFTGESETDSISFRLGYRF